MPNCYGFALHRNDDVSQYAIAIIDSLKTCALGRGSWHDPVDERPPGISGVDSCIGLDPCGYLKKDRFGSQQSDRQDIHHCHRKHIRPGGRLCHRHPQRAHKVGGQAGH